MKKKKRHVCCKNQSSVDLRFKCHKPNATELRLRSGMTSLEWFLREEIKKKGWVVFFVGSVEEASRYLLAVEARAFWKTGR